MHHFSVCNKDAGGLATSVLLFSSHSPILFLQAELAACPACAADRSSRYLLLVELVCSHDAADCRSRQQYVLGTQAR